VYFQADPTREIGLESLPLVGAEGVEIGADSIDGGVVVELIAQIQGNPSPEIYEKVTGEG
jgi:hypothetical protein